MARLDIIERKDEILQWIEENRSKAFIAQQLQCKPSTLNEYLKKMNIIYKGNQGSKGISHNSQYISALDYAKKASGVKSHVLKQKLIKDGVKEYKCEICGLSEWMGELIPLELHHKDNNHFNNELDNLQILCPNCHAQQPGNSGANMNKYATVLEQVDNTLLESVAEMRVSSSLTSSTNNKYKCIDCGIQISPKATRCKKCDIAFRKTTKPISREELKNLIRHYPMVQIGQQFGVSDNAIRKWCKSYNLPYQVKVIKKMSEEEWAII